MPNFSYQDNKGCWDGKHAPSISQDGHQSASLPPFVDAQHNRNTTKDVILHTAANYSNKHTFSFTYNFSSFNLNSSCIIHMLLCVECIGKEAYSVRQIMHNHIEFRKGGIDFFILWNNSAKSTRKQRRDVFHSCCWHLSNCRCNSNDLGMWPLCGVREVHREECRQTLNRSTTTTPDIQWRPLLIFDDNHCWYSTTTTPDILGQPLLIFDDNHSRYSANACTHTWHTCTIPGLSFLRSGIGWWPTLIFKQLAFALCFQGGLFRTEHIKHYEKNEIGRRQPPLIFPLDPSMLERVFSFLQCGIICLGYSTTRFCTESPLCLLGRVFHIVNITYVA